VGTTCSGTISMTAGSVTQTATVTLTGDHCDRGRHYVERFSLHIQRACRRSASRFDDALGDSTDEYQCNGAG